MFNAVQQFANLGRVLWTHPAEAVHHLPPDASTQTRELPGGNRILYVRDPELMRRLAQDKALDRGPGVNLLRSVFGASTLFLMPLGKAHARHVGDFNRLFDQRHIDALTPEIARLACKAVDAVDAEIRVSPHMPVDMQAVILRYLMDVGARALIGKDLDLSAHAPVFRRGVDALHREATSMVKTALAAGLPATASFMAKDARRAAVEFLEAGRQMLIAAAPLHGLADTLALRIMTRHGIDPATVTADTRFEPEVLTAISMDLAASLFTTQNLIEMTLQHFHEHPGELAALRELIRRDFPTGVGGVDTLRNCPTLERLIPVMLANSPVGIVARDVLTATSFTDENGQRRSLHPGDAVVLDISAAQQRHLPEVADALRDGDGPALDLLSRHREDAMQAFFHGPNQCPGRFLAIADAALFLIEMLSRMDGRPLDRTRIVEHGIVNRLTGSPLVQLTPAPPATATITRP